MATIAPFEGESKPTTFAAMLTQLTAIAHARVPPDQHGRLERGHAIVVAGGVFPEEDGTHYTVASHDDNETHAWLVGSTCPCPDAIHAAPQCRCKHWYAVQLYKRTLEELAAPLAPEEPTMPEADAAAGSGMVTPPPPHAPDQTLEAVAVSHQVPKEYLQMIHGRPFILYRGLLAMAHDAGLRELHAEFISVTAALALAKAEAVFADGRRFTEAADATQDNVGFTVKEHFARIALTRAKARCLRDALNIALCSLEELAVVAEEAPPAPEPDGWCDKHQCGMKLNHGKDGSTWLSHRLPTGEWCKGK
jgi:hypothetical protein